MTRAAALKPHQATGSFLAAVPSCENPRNIGTAQSLLLGTVLEQNFPVLQYYPLLSVHGYAWLVMPRFHVVFHVRVHVHGC